MTHEKGVKDMDPIGIIVSALASGAAAGLKPAAEKAIKDAYAGLKSMIQRKYSRVDLATLENKPESRSKRESVAEDLADAGATGDQELLDLAKALIDSVSKHDKTTATVIGVDLEEVKAAYLNIKKVTTSGTGVKVKKGEFEGGIDIGEVAAGDTDESSNP
jgi:predicted lipid-binding transport protein (Tim44 family)